MTTSTAAENNTIPSIVSELAWMAKPMVARMTPKLEPMLAGLTRSERNFNGP